MLSTSKKKKKMTQKDGGIPDAGSEDWVHYCFPKVVQKITVAAMPKSSKLN